VPRLRGIGIIEEEFESVLSEPDRESEANFGRLYRQKLVAHRLVRVVYNQRRKRSWW
jgi:hypothetical protein